MKTVTIKYREIEEGIWLADKPAGISSFDVIIALRKKLNLKKIGHAGTLDPFASGLMILGVGKGTKQLEQFLKLDKSYTVTAHLGVVTNTGDHTGIITKHNDCTVKEVHAFDVLSALIGTHELPVPAFAAVKRDGQKMYVLARKGVSIDRPVRAMEIQNIDVVEIDMPHLVFDVSVTSGVYIRSVVEYVGEQLGCGATTEELRRTRIGKFFIDDIDDIDVNGVQIIEWSVSPENWRYKIIRQESM